jgi:hypothetical protein
MNTTRILALAASGLITALLFVAIAKGMSVDLPDTRCSVSPVIQAPEFAISRTSVAPKLCPSIQQTVSHPSKQEETIHVTVNAAPDPDRRN